ncbi:hypothetical protein [Pseudanabaena phage PA-SR01]|nr:hypothetical protein [Pseudanabaena phage PA-SR01]
MQILSAKALRNLEVHNKLFNDLEYLIAFFVTEQKEGLNYAKLHFAEKEDISDETKASLKDLGYIVKWMDTANGSYYVVSWSEADAA